MAIVTKRVTVALSGGTLRSKTTKGSEKVVPTSALMSSGQPNSPFLANSWPGQPLLMHESGGQANTRLVRLPSVSSLAIAPSSQGTSAVGCTPVAHLSYALPFFSEKDVLSVDVVSSAIVGAVLALTTAAVAAPVQEPPLEHLPSSHLDSPSSHARSTSSVRVTLAVAPLASVTVKTTR